MTNFSGGDHSERNGTAAPPMACRPCLTWTPAWRAASTSCSAGRWSRETLLFYSAMLHGAPGVPAGSAHRRRGYATRWCGDDIVFDERPGTMHVGWKEHGFDCALEAGQPLRMSALHPDCA